MLSALRDKNGRKCGYRFQDENGRIYGYMVLRSKTWLYAVTVKSLTTVFKTKRSDLWLCHSTVEKLAIRDYGRKFVYASRDENGEYVGENDG